jgi:hypothetical protein
MIRPSAWWYASSAIPLIACIALGVVLIVDAVRSSIGPLHHFVTPGFVVPDLDDGDKRDIYVQTRGAPQSTGLSVSPSELACHIHGPRGETVPTDVADNSTLTDGGDRYRSVYTFTADADGRYLVRCTSPQERSIPLAVGPHIGVKTIVRVLGGIVAIFLGLLLAGAVAGLVAILRHRSKVKLQREQLGAAAGWGGPTAGGPWSPPPGG